jgi:hypothetical protein
MTPLDPIAIYRSGEKNEAETPRYGIGVIGLCREIKKN